MDSMRARTRWPSTGATPAVEMAMRTGARSTIEPSQALLSAVLSGTLTGTPAARATADRLALSAGSAVSSMTSGRPAMWSCARRQGTSARTRTALSPPRRETGRISVTRSTIGANFSSSLIFASRTAALPMTSGGTESTVRKQGNSPGLVRRAVMTHPPPQNHPAANPSPASRQGRQSAVRSGSGRQGASCHQRQKSRQAGPARHLQAR